MGIPLYFKRIYEDYPEIIVNHITGTNNLFLDLNFRQKVKSIKPQNHY